MGGECDYLGGASEEVERHGTLERADTPPTPTLARAPPSPAASPLVAFAHTPRVRDPVSSQLESSCLLLVGQGPAAPAGDRFKIVYNSSRRQRATPTII